MAIELDDILATIRQRESGGDYGAEAKGSSASGAYQFIDSTWRSLLQRYAVQGPPHAADAPAALQDYVAGRYVADILSDHGGDLRAVPAVWYTGSYDPAALDRVPNPEAGNRLSVRSYIDHWLSSLSEHSAGYRSGSSQVAAVVPDRPAAGGPTALDAFLTAALAQQGDRYVFGHETRLDDRDPDTFDCSELIQWAAAQAGVEMPDGSWLQYRALAQRDAALPIDEALRTPGALLFTFSSDPTVGGRPSRAHVAISLGDGRVMEARNPRKGVLISDASTHTWTHAAAIPELGVERSAGWPVVEPLGPAPVQFGLDSDSDGLLDEHERFIGTNPFAADTDLDGFIDEVEIFQHGTDPLVAADNVLTGGADGGEHGPPLSFLLTAAQSTAQPAVGVPPAAGSAPPAGLPPLPPVHIAAPPAPPVGGGGAPAGGDDPAQDELLFDLLEALSQSNPELAGFLAQHGIDGADDLDRLPTSFDVDDWL